MALTSLRFPELDEYVMYLRLQQEGPAVYDTLGASASQSASQHTFGNGYPTSQEQAGCRQQSQQQQRQQQQRQQLPPPALGHELLGWEQQQPRRVQLPVWKFVPQPQLRMNQLEQTPLSKNMEHTSASRPLSVSGSFTPDTVSPDASYAFAYAQRPGSEASSDGSLMNAGAIAGVEAFQQYTQVYQNWPHQREEVRGWAAQSLTRDAGTKEEPNEGLPSDHAEPPTPSYLPKFVMKRSTSGTTASSRSHSSWPSPAPPLESRKHVLLSPQMASPTPTLPAYAGLGAQPVPPAFGSEGDFGFSRDIISSHIRSPAVQRGTNTSVSDEWEVARLEAEGGEDTASLPSVPELSPEQLQAMAARKTGKSGAIGGLRIRLPQNGSPFSQGSLGHPTSCAEACPYVKRKGGCKLGADCDKCHLCFWQRPSVKAARQEFLNL